MHGSPFFVFLTGKVPSFTIDLLSLHPNSPVLPERRAHGFYSDSLMLLEVSAA